MTELLAAISEAVAAAGQQVDLALDEFPPLSGGDRVYVVIPHEFHAWGDTWPSLAQRERTIALCTENAGTEWFDATVDLLPQFPTALSINRSSAAEIERRGFRCGYVQLGYAPSWDRWHGDESAARDIDVLYLGAADSRRDPLLADIGGQLWAWRCQLLIPPLEPRTRPRPDFLLGTDKYERLRSTRVLLNLHRTTSSAFEWMRFLEAIANGCVVVSEPCRDSGPLIAGEHFVVSDVGQMAREVDLLLRDPDRLRGIRHRAYEFVRDELPMSLAASRLLDIAGTLPRRPPAPAPLPTSSDARRQSSAMPDGEVQSAGAEHCAGPRRRPTGARSRFKQIAANPIARVRTHVGGLTLIGRARTIASTPAYRHATPRVSVLCITEGDLGRAVAAVEPGSVSAGELEILLAVAHRPADAASALLRGHPHLPMRVLQIPASDGDASHGDGWALNRLVERARGEYVFIHPIGGGIYPSTLERLLATLDATPEALFSFPMVGVFDGEVPVGLLGTLPWEPERMRRGSWIDITTLLRRTSLVELGCFTDDSRLAGWEAFDLWCRCVEHRHRGVHVPQVLAWRRVSAASRTADGSVDDPSRWALMRERHPWLREAPD